MEKGIEKLYEYLEQHGRQGRVVTSPHLVDLQSDLHGQHEHGAFDEEFYQNRLTFFKYYPPEELPLPTSLIVVATPRPQSMARFTYGGKTVTLVLPPTYAGYTYIANQVKELLRDWLALQGYHVALASLPLKSLAVHSGLAAYGRNNISYVPGMGSYFQLTALYSDLPCAEDSWDAPRMMSRCEQCTACVRKCPTGAISPERFMLHAERCLVYHNEKSGAHPFPDWIDPAWHECIIGCMQCQTICPENKAFLGWSEDNQEFTSEETTLLLQGVSQDQLPAATAKKLAWMELLDSLDILPRNLGVFFR